VERMKEMLTLIGEASQAVHEEMLKTVKARTVSLVRAMGSLSVARGEGYEKNVDMEDV
jgi:hypothetical protein